MVSKVENGDYNGDYFRLLLKVCFALNKTFDIQGPGTTIAGQSECSATVV